MAAGLFLLTVANPEVNVVVVRRFGNTLRDSIYTQVLWAVDALGLSEYFKAKISPLEIVYIPTGQRIVLDSLTYSDEPGEEPYYHDQVVWVDDTPDGKVQTSVYRRDLGGNWLDIIPDGDDHSIDAIRYAMMDDVLRG